MKSLLALLPVAGLVAWASHSPNPKPVAQQAFAPRLQAQIGHVGISTGVSWSHDGRFVLSVADDGAPILWDAASHTQIRTLDSYKNIATKAVFSADSKSVITGSEDGTISVWNTESGQLQTTFPPLPGSIPDGQRRPTGRISLAGDLGTDSISIPGPTVYVGVTALAASPDGRWAAAGNAADATVAIVDLKTGQIAHTLQGAEERVCSVAWTGANRLVSADATGGIQFWNLDQPKTPVKARASEASVLKVSVSQDQKWVVASGLDQSVTVWDAGTGKQIAKLKDASIPGVMAEFASNSEHLIFESTPNVFDNLNALSYRVQTVEWRTGKVIRELKLPGGYRGMPYDACVSPDGKRLLVAALDKAIREFDLQTGAMQGECSGQANILYGSQLMAGGKVLAAGTDGGNVTAVNLVTNSVSRSIVKEGDNIKLIVASPDRTKFAVSSYLGEIQIIDAVSMRKLTDVVPEFQRIAKLENYSVSPDEIWWSPDGTMLYTAFGYIVCRNGATDGEHQMAAQDSRKPIPGLEKYIPEGADQADYMLTTWSRDGSKSYLYGAGPHIFVREKGGTADAREIAGVERVLNDIAFTQDGRSFVTGGKDERVTIFDAQSEKKLRTIEGIGASILDLAFFENDRFLAVTTVSGKTRLFEFATGRELTQLRNQIDSIRSLNLTPDGKRLVAVQVSNRLTYDYGDVGVDVFDFATGQRLCQTIFFKSGDMCVIDKDGRYDATDPSNLEGLNWMIGTEAIGLGQFKSMYYEPNLLAKHLGLNPEPLRPVTPLTQVTLYPSVEATLAPDAKSASITLSNRGGGLGKAEVRLNGALIATLQAPQANAAKHTFRVDLATAEIQARLLPKSALAVGQQNRLDVVAFNSDAYLASRSKSLAVPAPEKTADPPRLFLIVSGTSDYVGEKIDLKYAAADALSMAEALGMAARRWLGDSAVELRTLVADHGETGGTKPTKAALRQAFAEVAKSAKSTDIVVVYFAGHGINQAGTVSDYFYLCADAESADLEIPEVRERVAVSGSELGEWLAAMPTQKQVLILDTCASGQVVTDVSTKRDVPGDVVRSWERLKDRTGVFVLAGCASDAVSYEASRFGQGLLTYALLEAMARDEGALRRDPASPDDRAFVDVMGIYQRAADRVPDLVRELGIGGIQRPEIKTRGNATSFDIGLLTKDDRSKIPISKPRPIILRPSFEEQDQPEDPLDLTQAFENALRAASSRGKNSTMAFWDVPEHAGCYRVRGRYREEGGKVTVTVYLSRLEPDGGRLRAKAIADFPVQGDPKKPTELAQAILAEVDRRVSGQAG